MTNFVGLFSTTGFIISFSPFPVTEFDCSFSPISLSCFGSFSADEFELVTDFLFFDFAVLDSISDSEPASVSSKLYDDMNEELEIEEDNEYVYPFFPDLGLAHLLKFPT